MSQQPDNIQTEQAAAKAVKNGKKKPEENLTMAQELYQTLQSLVWWVTTALTFCLPSTYSTPAFIQFS